jgi:hypothetical protein
MNELDLRAILRRHLGYVGIDQDISHEMYDDDVVVEFPQSRERFEGKANVIAWRKIYPAAVTFDIGRIRGEGNFWVVESTVRYDGGAVNYGCSIYEFKGDKVVRETIYVGAGWDAPEWRAKWRAVWQDEP